MFTGFPPNELSNGNYEGECAKDDYHLTYINKSQVFFISDFFQNFSVFCKFVEYIQI